jgi:hypothetical protein
MSFTQTDLDAVKEAIIDLASGQRVVSVSIAGKTIQYGIADLNQLKALRKEIQSEIQALSGIKRYYHVRTSKGF